MSSASSSHLGLTGVSPVASVLDPLDGIPLGTMADGSPTPILGPAPLEAPYAEFSRAWLQAAGQSFTAADIKTLMDNVYAQVMHSMQQVVAGTESKFKDSMRRRKHNILQLQQQVNQLEATRQRQEAEIATLKSELAMAYAAFKASEKAYTELKACVESTAISSVGAGALSFSQSFFPPMKEPDTFNGDKGAKLDDWLESMALWLRNRDVKDEEKKVETAMTYLRGSAKKVMQSYFDKVSNQLPLGSYSDFVEELKKSFQQSDKKDRAIAEFTQLVETKGTSEKNYGEFAAKFRSLARQTGFSNE